MPMTTTRLARLDEIERICQDRDDAYRGVPEEIDRLLCLLRQWGEARLAADEYRDRNWEERFDRERAEEKARDALFMALTGQEEEQR